MLLITEASCLVGVPMDPPLIQRGPGGAILPTGGDSAASGVFQDLR